MSTISDAYKKASSDWKKATGEFRKIADNAEQEVKAPILPRVTATDATSYLLLRKERAEALKKAAEAAVNFASASEKRLKDMSINEQKAPTVVDQSDWTKAIAAANGLLKFDIAEERLFGKHNDEAGRTLLVAFGVAMVAKQLTVEKDARVAHFEALAKAVDHNGIPQIRTLLALSTALHADAEAQLAFAEAVATNEQVGRSVQLEKVAQQLTPVTVGGTDAPSQKVREAIERLTNVAAAANDDDIGTFNAFVGSHFHTVTAKDWAAFVSICSAKAIVEERKSWVIGRNPPGEAESLSVLIGTAATNFDKAFQGENNRLIAVHAEACKKALQQIEGQYAAKLAKDPVAKLAEILGPGLA